MCRFAFFPFCLCVCCSTSNITYSYSSLFIAFIHRDGAHIMHERECERVCVCVCSLPICRIVCTIYSLSLGGYKR